MARAIEKGATYLDKLCHKLYDEPKGRGFQVDGKCRRCGGPLMTYYCEDRLHLIACEKCGTLALTKAVSPQVAANLTLRQPTLTPPNEWVSVEEGLPKPDIDVLLYFGDSAKLKMPVGGKYELDDGWYSVTDGEYYTDCDTPPIYWMPLPEEPDRRPPEGDANA